MTSQKLRNWCLNRLGSNLRQSWRKAVCYSLGGIRCLYTAVLVSPVQSRVQSRVQVLQRPLVKCLKDPNEIIHGHIWTCFIYKFIYTCRLYWASALYQLHSYFICEPFLFQLDSSHLEHFNLQLIWIYTYHQVQIDSAIVVPLWTAFRHFIYHLAYRMQTATLVILYRLIVTILICYLVVSLVLLFVSSVVICPTLLLKATLLRIILF